MEKKSKKSIIIGVTSLLLVMLLLIGLTYAYYRTRIIGNESEEPSISVKSKKLEVVYQNESAFVSVQDAEPGDVFIKTFEVSNTGDEITKYSIILDNINNTFVRTDWIYELYEGKHTKEELKSLTPIKNGNLIVEKYQVISTSQSIDVGTESNPSIDEYTLKIEYVNYEDIDQSEDMGASLSLRINIGDDRSLLDTIKVGDYVNYTYTSNSYSAQNVGVDIVQTFNSADNTAKVDTWRILNKNNGVITLIGEVNAAKTITTNRLALLGINGWLNGSAVLDEMCETLYSGEYGTARSIDRDDINNVRGANAGIYHDVYAYIDNKGVGQKLMHDSGYDLGTNLKTIGDLIEIYGEIANNNFIPSGINVNELELNNYGYTLTTAYNPYIAGKVIEMLTYSNGETPYWLATRLQQPDFSKGYIKYRMAFVNAGNQVTSRGMFDSKDGVDPEDKAIDFTYRVVPVVVLNAETYFAAEQVNGVWQLIK